jgi:8-oxo-dGTP pyrophosphatase MutT (NUDIX family)
MPDTGQHPTPYAEVNALLFELLAGARGVLGAHFVGMYLYGSLAVGDFAPDNSDIDFVVVTEDELPGEQLRALQLLHARLARGPSKWAKELEGSYIPRRALRRYDPRRARHPHIDRGQDELRVEQHDSDWIVQRYSLREHGVSLAGPDIKTLIDPISADQLRRGVRELLQTWWAPMLDDVTRLLSPGYRTYAILTMCRMLYTLEHGTIVSKPAAALWAQTALDRRWTPLIRQALASPREPLPENLNETLGLLRHTLERWAAPPAKVFGAIIAGATYGPRPAAYAVVKRADGAVAVVKTRRGCFLPGGGSLPGETPAETVRREVREELARDVRLTREIGRAVQYFRADEQYYRMEAVFFAAEFIGEPDGAGEHELGWLDTSETDNAFFHQCHAWAVKQP